MNVETRKHLKPRPVGDRPPIRTARAEMVDGRYDRVPEEMDRLLRRLERAKQKRGA